LRKEENTQSGAIFCRKHKILFKGAKFMKAFTTGLLIGTALVAGIAVATNPMGKREIRRIRNSGRRAVRGVQRRINKWS